MKHNFYRQNAPCNAQPTQILLCTVTEVAFTFCGTAVFFDKKHLFTAVLNHSQEELSNYRMHL